MITSSKDFWIKTANNFGLWRIRYALEDTIFALTDTKNNALILSVLKEKTRAQEKLFQDIIDVVDHQLCQRGIEHFDILYRRKNDNVNSIPDS